MPAAVIEAALGDLHKTSVEIATDVAIRVADPAVLGAAVEASGRQTAFPTVGWRPESLAAGHAGLAVLFATLADVHRDERWDRVGHSHLKRAVEAAAGQLPQASLSGGLAGLGFAAHALADGRDRYQRLLNGVDAELTPLVAASARHLARSDGCSVFDFDLISGLSGVGAYLVQRGREAPARPSLDLVLHTLAALLADQRQPSRWHTPAHLQGEAMAADYPGGSHNCGMAHGVPGPLALLSLATLEGFEVPASRTAIRVAADWLTRHHYEDEWGPDWPNAVAVTGRAEHQTGSAQPGFASAAPSRAAWCYGAPGVARSLWLAGQALDDAGYCELGIAGIRGSLRRPAQLRGITSPTFCHGTAGLSQIVTRFAQDTGLPDLTTAAEALTAELVAAYRPESLLGYCNVEPGGVLVDQPGLLDGAPGVALTLLTAGGPSRPTWDRMFLLA